MRTAKHLRILLTTLAASLTALAWAAPSHAGLIEIATFTGSGATLPTGGNTVSAAATFYVDSAAPNVLIIDLVNTSKFSDTHPGGGNLGGEDVLTGLVFDISGSPAYATAPSAQNLTPSLSLSGNGTTSTLIGSGSLTDTWTNDITPGGNPNVATGNYGISTSGFSGAFKGQGLTGPDYGIVGPGNSSGTIAGGILPQVMDGLEFTLTFKAGTDLTSASFSTMQFLYGTAGVRVQTGGGGPPNPPGVPEPSSLTLAGIGVIALLGYRLRNRSR